MKIKLLTENHMRSALKCLDEELSAPLTLLIGGGGAMILAYQFPLATSDIDGISIGGNLTAADLDLLIKKIAAELHLPNDWLNPYFSTFTHVLPSDYGDRLRDVLQFPYLRVRALSKEDLLIMKCFAARLKDRPHAKALILQGANLKFVETHMEYLKNLGIPKASAALDFLDDLNEE